MQMQTPLIVVQPSSTPIDIPLSYPVRRSAGCGCAGCGGMLGLIGAVIGIIAAIVGVAVSVMPSQMADMFNHLTTSVPALAAITTAIPVPASAFTFGGEGTGSGLFSDARNIAIDNKNNVYVSDFKTGLIQKFDADGNYLTGW
jgi:hypothetical protein